MMEIYDNRTPVKNNLQVRLNDHLALAFPALDPFLFWKE